MTILRVEIKIRFHFWMMLLPVCYYTCHVQCAIFSDEVTEMTGGWFLFVVCGVVYCVLGPNTKNNSLVTFECP